MFNKLYKSKNETSLAEFRAWLEKSGASEITIKNYVSDVKAFLANDKDDGRYSPATIKRKGSAVKKYLEFSSTTKTAPYPMYVLVFVIFIILYLAGQATNKNIGKEIIVSESKETVTLPLNATISSSDKMPKVSGETSEIIVLKPNSEILHTSNSFSDPIAVTASSDRSVKQREPKIETIVAGKQEVLILDSLATESSFVSLTPKTSTYGQSLYVKSQGEGYFIVAIDEPQASNIRFQWKLDNTEVYHSMF